MRMTKFIAPALAAVFGLIVLSGCSRAPQVATVNGEAITKEDFYAYLERKPNVRVQTQQGAVDAQLQESLGFQALRDLVNRKVLVQLAKDENVYPTDADVKSELDYREAVTKGFMDTLQKSGLTLDQIRSEIIIDLCQFRLVTKGVTVTSEQVDKFIKDNPTMFQEPPRIELLWIVVESAKERAAVDSEIKSGQTFSAVAMKYSRAPGARENQGRFPTDNYDKFPPALKKLVDATAEGTSTQWQEDGGKLIRFNVAKKTPAKKVDIDATLKERVRRQLLLQQGSKGTDLNKRLLTKLKGSKVDVTKAGLTDLWNNAYKSLKAEDVGTGANSGSTAPPSGAATNAAPGAK